MSSPGKLTSKLRRALPESLAPYLVKARKRWYQSSAGRTRFGDLRRVSPIAGDYGYGRGTPVDRYYIDDFLSSNSHHVMGRVLEIKDSYYTRELGGHNVVRSDVLDIDPTNPEASIIADLAAPEGLVPPDAFDCIIFTQTLQLIYDAPAAVRTLYEALKPGGILLVTVPGICRIGESELSSWCWTFSELSVLRMFGEYFSEDLMEVSSHGNVLVATAFLHGVSVEELQRDELDHIDPQYPICVTLKATKATV